jgi:hypothetical protein
LWLYECVLKIFTLFEDLVGARLCVRASLPRQGAQSGIGNPCECLNQALIKQSAIKAWIAVMSRSESIRAKAEHCRQMASKAREPYDREQWLKLADDWIVLLETSAHARRNVSEREH